MACVMRVKWTSKSQINATSDSVEDVCPFGWISNFYQQVLISSGNDMFKFSNKK